MTTSIAALCLQISSEEGTKLFVYDDATGEEITPGSIVKGHPTIGTGRALDTRGIAPDEARTMLLNDLQGLLWRLGLLDWFQTANDSRQRALVDMAFQMGYVGLMEFQNMISAIKVGDWARAEEYGWASKWARETPNRAKRVLSLFNPPTGS